MNRIFYFMLDMLFQRVPTFLAKYKRDNECVIQECVPWELCKTQVFAHATWLSPLHRIA